MDRPDRLRVMEFAITAKPEMDEAGLSLRATTGDRSGQLGRIPRGQRC
jgi:hypothetical protein